MIVCSNEKLDIGEVASGFYTIEENGERFYIRLCVLGPATREEWLEYRANEGRPWPGPMPETPWFYRVSTD